MHKVDLERYERDKKMVWAGDQERNRKETHMEAGGRS